MCETEQKLGPRVGGVGSGVWAEGEGVRTADSPLSREPSGGLKPRTPRIMT